MPSAGRCVRLRTTWVKETYRSRFAIETSYRQMHQARIRTCTRDPLLRLLYVAIALMLRNVWVWLHWELLAERRRGHRRRGSAPADLPSDAVVVATLRRTEVGNLRRIRRPKFTLGLSYGNC